MNTVDWVSEKHRELFRLFFGGPQLDDAISYLEEALRLRAGARLRRRSWRTCTSGTGIRSAPPGFGGSTDLIRLS